MRAVRDFEDFVKAGTVKKQSPDKSRAEFLVKESENAFRLLLELKEKIEINDESANMFIKSCYDVLMELIKAKMLLSGYNASGFGAHEAEVSFLRLIGFKETDVQFYDQIRFFRNGMIYYGTMLDKVYAEKVIEFTKQNYDALKELLNAELRRKA